MAERDQRPAIIGTKVIAELRTVMVVAIESCPELPDGGPHLWSTQKIRVGLIGARGAHLAEGEMLCCRCGTTAVLRVAV